MVLNMGCKAQVFFAQYCEKQLVFALKTGTLVLLLGNVAWISGPKKSV